MSVPFDINTLAPSANIWGPPQEIPQTLRFSDIPYAPFSKGDKLGKAADWNVAEAGSKDAKDKGRKGQRDYFHAYGASAASSFAAEDDKQGDDFEVVDSKANPAKNLQQTTTVLKGARKNQNQFQKKPAGSSQSANSTQKRSGYNHQNNNRRNWRDDKQERIREASVKVEESWKVVSSVELHKLTKLNFEVKDGEELGSYGAVNPYNKKIEKSAGAALKVIDKAIYNPTASDDPVIQALKSQNVANVYATDSVIVQLMCATKSVYSWDIIASKKDGVISFDKRDGSNIDRITVDENSQDPPSDTLDSNINNALNLSLEATFVNQNFVANSVLDESTIKLSKPNPFHSDSAEPLLSKGYKYKKFLLRNNQEDEEPTSVVIRTEFDSKDVTTNQNLAIKAVHQYSTTGIDWKTKFNTQRGAIIATELKNNNNKYAKWATQAILAGIHSIKLGFLARANPKDSSRHVIVGTVPYTPDSLAAQINLSTGNGWGIVKSYIDIIAAQEDGKYVILRDPNSPKITLYKVPENSFDEE